MSTSATVDSTMLEQWLAQKLSADQIQQQLSSMGYDESSISHHLDAFKKLRNEKRRWNGFLCMGLGALIGFISCVLSLINPIPELYYITLYGLTSVAIIVVFLGLYFVFE